MSLMTNCFSHREDVENESQNSQTTYDIDTTDITSVSIKKVLGKGIIDTNGTPR